MLCQFPFLLFFPPHYRRLKTWLKNMCSDQDSVTSTTSVFKESDNPCPLPNLHIGKC